MIATITPTPGKTVSRAMVEALLKLPLLPLPFVACVGVDVFDVKGVDELDGDAREDHEDEAGGGGDLGVVEGEDTTSWNTDIVVSAKE